MIVPYNLDGSDQYYKNYYSNQVGSGLSIYRGATVQRGHGIGGLFSSLFKGAMPLLKSGLKTVGKELLGAGVDIARDALAGRDVKQSAKERMMLTGDNLLGRLSHKMSGNGLTQPIRKRHSAARRKKHPCKKRNTGTKGSSFFKDVSVTAS